MKTIILTNVVRAYNFGGPSILYGIEALLDNLYGPDVRTVFLEAVRSKNDVPLGEYPFQTYTYYMFDRKHPLRTIFGFQGVNGIAQIRSIIKKSDLIIDLYGICFCDNILKTKLPPLFYRYVDFGEYTIDIVSKLFYKKTVLKNSASFGPINKKYTVSSANYICRRIFDAIISREEKSMEALNNALNRDLKICFSPDIANLMPYEKSDDNGGYIVLSISHQMKRQWKSEESYYDCIVNLCRHISDKTDERIVFVPNEFRPGDLNDLTVSEELKSLLEKHSLFVQIIDPGTHSALEIKNIIANSDAMIGSRYHSCVAALSAGVPALVIGWHYKYEELLRLYNQEKWLVTGHNCSSKKLIDTFDEFWKRHEENQTEISRTKKAVVDAIYAVYGPILDEVLWSNSCK